MLKAEVTFKYYSPYIEEKMRDRVNVSIVIKSVSISSILELHKIIC